jgi:hypothetical protein
MRDPYTQRPLVVLTDDGKGGRIVIRVEILDKVKKLFDEHGIRYWMDDNILYLDNKPPVAFMNLNRQVDAKWAQGLLDGAD